MTNDDLIVVELRQAMAAVSAGHHVDPATVDAALARLDTRPVPRRRTGYLIAAAAAAVALTAALVYFFLPSSRSERTAPSSGPNCHDVVTNVLPTWARSGFTRRGLHTAHVMGAHGRILAVLFAQPLRSPPAQQEANKILWVAKGASGGTLVIHAELAGSGRRAIRVLPDTAGPSYVNMPAPGCWHFTVSWSGTHDSLDIPYSR